VSRVLADRVEVYLFRRRHRKVEFLTLRRSGGRALPHVWQPVTGKLLRGEHPVDGARREVLEETGLEPERWWVLETATVYFDPAADAVRVLPLFAAEIGAKSHPRLSAEHDDHRFLSAAAAARRYLWHSQVRALEAVRHEVLAGGPRARALEVTARVRRGARRRAQADG
jgi:dATP pyrophosphohydrolase